MWKTLHAEYKKIIKLAALKENSYNKCFAIEIKLADPAITDKRRHAAKAESYPHQRSCNAEMRDAGICESSSAA